MTPPTISLRVANAREANTAAVIIFNIEQVEFQTGAGFCGAVNDNDRDDS
jgi:hypothetical protein